MSPKKTQKGNLENRKNTFALVGLVLVLGLVYTVFELFAVEKKTTDLFRTENVFEFMDVTETPIVDLKPPQEVKKETVSSWIVRVTKGNENIDWEKVFGGIPFPDDVILDLPEPIEIVDPIIEEAPKAYSEVMPEYPGGNDAMYAFLVQNLIYPEKPRKLEIQGTSLIQFVVEKDGSVTNTVVLSSLHPDCDNEAIRVIKMLKFHPGLVNRKPVRVYYMIPVQFTLQN